MSTTAPNEPLLTIDEYADLPDDDGWKTELVRGMVVREPIPGYEHGRIQARILYILTAHVDAHAPELACVGEWGVIVEEYPPTVRGPDLAVVRRDRTGDLHRAGFLRGAPELAVEVVSPSNRAADIAAKVEEYLGAGARLVWVVYPEMRTIAVHESPREARFVREPEELTGGAVLPGFSVPVLEFFK